ncbi:GerAB/ArcD/ProY family transporter [Terribacillus sp. JSM ZJ617]|uniref:GerAB/ArcD/ProY family transporter n=1 Tax=Terribacillus sp. JSM ZJ617 TaxID=3342119 RepID=UPI0035A9354F
MEPAQINSRQLFVLMLLFQLGSSLILPSGISAAQDAWLAILGGTVAGTVLFLIYYKLHSYYPDIPATEYGQRIFGTFLGKILGFLYVIYFCYLSARILRDFGEMLVTISYTTTPLFVINLLWMILIVYTVRKGIESLSRVAELLVVLVFLLAATSFILVVFNGDIDMNNLRPVLEKGVAKFLRSILETTFLPFGELVVFAMIFPYLNNIKKGKIAGILAVVVAGLILSVTMFINISVLGPQLVSRSQFPLLSTIETIDIAEFLERLDVFFIIGVIIGGFIKISVFFYVAIMGTANLFKIKDSAALVYPVGFIVLLLSISIASSISEHLHEGFRVVPMYLHLPFQIILPFLLLVVAYIRNRKNPIRK